MLDGQDVVSEMILRETTENWLAASSYAAAFREARTATPMEAVIPAHAGIQYAAASRFYHCVSGILGRPVEPGDDS